MVIFKRSSKQYVWEESNDVWDNDTDDNDNDKCTKKLIPCNAKDICNVESFHHLGGQIMVSELLEGHGPVYPQIYPGCFCYLCSLPSKLYQHNKICTPINGFTENSTVLSLFLLTKEILRYYVGMPFRLPSLILCEG